MKRTAEAICRGHCRESDGKRCCFAVDAPQERSRFDANILAAIDALPTAPIERNTRTFTRPTSRTAASTTAATRATRIRRPSENTQRYTESHRRQRQRHSRRRRPPAEETPSTTPGSSSTRVSTVQATTKTLRQFPGILLRERRSM